MRIAFVIVVLHALVLAGSARAGEMHVAAPVLNVRVHDYAHVSKSTLAEAQQLVATYYAAIGVRTKWAETLSRQSTDDLKTIRDGPEDLTVIVLNREMAATKALTADAVGSAAVGSVSGGKSGGRIAYVMYDRVEHAAFASEWPTPEFLGFVIAHELGHLLLPPGSHAAAGLMRGDWNIDALRHTTGRHMAFLSAQGALIRDRLWRLPDQY